LFVIVNIITFQIGTCSNSAKCDGITVICPCGTSSSEEFTQNKESNVMCLIFDGVVDGNNLYYFSVTVDDFTLLSLQGSSLYNTTLWNTSAHMSVEVGGYRTTVNRTLITILSNGNRYVVTPLSIVIVINNGNVESISWDDGCYSCIGSESCINGNCGTQVATISTTEYSNCDNDACDAKLFISWYGTDKKGDYLLSAGQRLSQFEQASASSYYNYAKTQVKTVSVPVPQYYVTAGSN